MEAGRLTTGRFAVTGRAEAAAPVGGLAIPDRWPLRPMMPMTGSPVSPLARRSQPGAPATRRSAAPRRSARRAVPRAYRRDARTGPRVALSCQPHRHRRAVPHAITMESFA
jgi:hypothetical protein